jgi:hypothetical protein
MQTNARLAEPADWSLRSGAGAVLLIVSVLVATAAEAETPGLSGLLPPPGDVPRPAPAYDPDAPWCAPEQNRDQPHGILVEHAGLVLHVCREGPSADRAHGDRGWLPLDVNLARVPGLTFDGHSGWFQLGDFATYEEGLRGEYSELTYHYPVRARTERHGGALYEVWHNPAPFTWGYNQTTMPWTELQGPLPYPRGNFYLFVAEPGTAALPEHSVRCHAEPKNIWEDEPTSCFVSVSYRGREAKVQLFGGGPGYGRGSGHVEMHPLFPHFARDIETLLRATDATDDPERQACVRGGGDWREERCDEGQG